MLTTRSHHESTSLWWMPFLVYMCFSFSALAIAALLQHQSTFLRHQLDVLITPSLLLIWVGLATVGRPSPLIRTSIRRMGISVATGLLLWLSFLPLQAKHGGPPELTQLFGSCILTPLAEEWYFRGYLFPCLAQRFGSHLALLLSSVMFGFLHNSSSVHFLLALVAGAVFGLLNHDVRGVTPSFPGHSTYNLLTSVF